MRRDVEGSKTMLRAGFSWSLFLQLAGASTQMEIPRNEVTTPGEKGVVDCDFSAYSPLSGDWDSHENFREYMPDPIYPDEARAADIEGTVDVRLVVDGRGEVLRLCAVGGDERLRAASAEAAGKSRWKPLVINGHRAPFVVHQFTIRYELP
jgi:outer membrane biosynthesis protein TonB